MPTVLRKDGFEILIYTHDHLPPHVHVFHSSEEVIILIETGAIRESWMSGRNERAALRLVEEEREFLLQRWHEIGPIP
jgi:hypothetical protein